MNDPVTIKARFVSGSIAKQTAILELGRSFPCFRDSPHFSIDACWDPDAVQQSSQAFSAGELHALRFILGVWKPGHCWPCGEFDILDACATWDGQHRAVFATWALDPWWPHGAPHLG